MEEIDSAPDSRTRASRLALMGALTAFLALGMLACRDDSSGEPVRPEAAASFAGQEFSRDAHHDTAAMLREDLALTRHSSDGAGQVQLDWIEDLQGQRLQSVPAGSRARFALTFQAGPEGVARGGSVFLQSSPFWGWDSPQFEAPDAPGFTTVSTTAPGVTLDAQGLDQGLARIAIGGRALAAGERLSFVFGAGAEGARVDMYAESEARIWIFIDGDGDGVRAPVATSPRLRIRPGPPALLIVNAPTTARPGTAVTLRVAVLDELGSAGVDVKGRVVLELPAGIRGPEAIELGPAQHGLASTELQVERAGVFRIRASLEVPAPGATGASSRATLRAQTGPLVATSTVAPVLWGDLHGHTSLSDGTGTPEDYFDYARYVSGLDIVAITDHDHWGMRFLDATPAWWQRIRQAARDANRPGEFVAVLGFEWTSWLHGHRHVLYFDDDDSRNEVLSSLDPEIETPAQLWDALRGRDALTFAHHSAGGPISTNWGYPPDPVLEPVTEIASVHGSSEAPDSPGLIYNAVPGNFVRDALGAGYRLGLIGSGDSHDGHPGLVHIAAPGHQGGLAAFIGSEHTRASVLGTLRARRVYATNGARIWLRVTLDGQEMGTVLATTIEDQTLRVAVAAEAPLALVNFVRNGTVIRSLAGEEQLEWNATLKMSPLKAGDTLYVRVIQRGGGTAWSSPFFCCDEPAAEPE